LRAEERSAAKTTTTPRWREQTTSGSERFGTKKRRKIPLWNQLWLGFGGAAPSL